ncbi:protein kinase-like domain, concanavalin A-like lectin/glucanase domain protein [Tanacetum coccineum]
MPCSCDRMGMWDRRVSIGQTLNENSGSSTLEPLMELIIEHCIGKCNHSNGNEMVRAEGEIDNLTMEQYLALTRGNQAPGVVKPEIRGNVNFKIKSQCMRESREDTFSGNKNDDAHEHVEAAKRWVDRLPLRTINSWDLLKNAFIQRYCPPSRTAKQLEEIRNFKQERDETLYQAWEWYNDLLYKCPTHDINNHQKIMADHSQKWHDAVEVLKEVKGVEEVKYREFSRPFPNNRYDGRFQEGYDQPSSGEKRPSLTKIINKYMDEASKRQAEQVKWLKKFYQSTKATRETHDKIIQGLEGKEQETDDSGMAKAVTTLEASLKKKREEPKKVKQNEQDPGSFILPCSIRKLDFKNALADLGANISIMPFSMYKRLGIGKLEPINMVIEMADNTKCTPKGIVENLLIKIDRFIFPVDFVILDMVENIRMPIILGRPLLATAHAQESYEEIVYKITNVENEKYSAPQEKGNIGILDYLKPRSYDGFIDLDDEAYNKRKCRLLGMTYEEPTPILIEKAKVTGYTVGPGETYTKVKVLGVEKIPRIGIMLLQ